MSNLLINVENLGKRFNREWIFRDLTFDFKQGQTYAITGPNGSGKSTLLQILWGQMPPSKGTVSYYLGRNEVPDDDIYRQVSVATPYMDLIEEFTLKEQLEFHFKTKPIRTGYSVATVMQAMYLEEARDKFISNFSSGMKQRLKLALAFYTDTPALFLDEPGTNLDSQAFTWYQDNLKNSHGQKLIFIASNQPDEYPVEAEKLDLSELKALRDKVTL